MPQSSPRHRAEPADGRGHDAQARQKLLDDDVLVDTAESPQTAPWTGVPLRPLTAVLFACLPEAFSEIVLFPFIYQMVKDLGDGLSDGQVAVYVGLLGSVIYLPLFATNIIAGGLSDRIGRRNVMLVGCAGNAVGNLIFGMATNLTTAFIGRALTGVFFFNSTITKSVLGDVSTPATRGFVYGLYGCVFGATAMLAPVIGGVLVHPANDGGLFEGNEFLATHPYFLPFSLVTVLCGVSFALLIVWLPTTRHGISASATDSSAAALLDPGMLTPRRASASQVAGFASPQTSAILVEDEHLGVSLVKDAPAKVQVLVNDDEDGQACPSPSRGLFGKAFGKMTTDLRGICSRTVVVAFVIYALLAFAYALYYTLVAIWGAAPRAEGGLEYQPERLSTFGLSYGVTKVAYQLLVFPRAIARLGARNTLRIGAVLIVATMVGASFLAGMSPEYAGWQYVGALAVSSLMGTCDVFGFLSVIVMLTDGVPAAQLGLVHGVGSTVAALARMAGPAIAGATWSLGISHLGGSQLLSFALIALIAVAEYGFTLAA